MEDCSKLITELASNNKSKKRKFEINQDPGSQYGVMDVSLSTQSSNDSWAVASSVSASSEPMSKKTRTSDLDQLVLTASDLLCIPR